MKPTYGFQWARAFAPCVEGVTQTMNSKAIAITLGLALSISSAFSAAADPAAVAPGKWTNNSYQFERGFPTTVAAQKAYDELDLNRAVEAYRFFYPTVSGSAIFKG